MPERYIDKDERYPDYELQNEPYYSATPFEFTDEELADYQRVRNEYADWQEKLKAMVGDE